MICYVVNDVISHSVTKLSTQTEWRKLNETAHVSHGTVLQWLQY